MLWIGGLSTNWASRRGGRSNQGRGQGDVKLWRNLDGSKTTGQTSGGGNLPATVGSARALGGEALLASDWKNQNKKEENGTAKQARFGGLTAA